MTPKELRQKMREQKRALRRQMAETRRNARAALDQNPAVHKARRKRLLRRAAGLTLLLLALLFIRCDCGPRPERPLELARVVDGGTPRPVAEVKPKVRAIREPPLHGELKAQSRGRFQGELTPSPGWLDDYRLQVAARSPRLAECFKGSERPGALRWSAAINPNSGAVSDHALEPVGVGSVEGAQRECLLAALSWPSYKLRLSDEERANEDLPRRVSIVLEF